MKKLLLTGISVLLIILFFLIPRNGAWFNSRIVGYWNDFTIQRSHLDLEYRKAKRLENSYSLSRQIADSVSRSGDESTALVLVPPSAYFKDRGIDYHVPEPAVFYYYTGVKTTWINSNMTEKANWIVAAENGKLKIIRVKERDVLIDSLAIFKRYPPSL
jgi:hypothetical protein